MREKLLDQMEMEMSRPVILVVAGAGYGKSIAVSQWLDRNSRAYCWISLSEDCNDLRLFLEYLCVSIQTSFPESLNAFSDILIALKLPPIEEIRNTLINELNSINQEFYLVIDDYYLIKNKAIHQLLNDLIHFTPEKIHFVIISRTDPPFKLSSLKAYEKVYDLRMNQLRFSVNEIQSYSKLHYGTDLDEVIAKSIEEKTEGWIIGIRLILSEISKGKNIFESIRNIQGEKDLLSNFLIEEVFSNLSKNLQSSLLFTSLFDRFNLDLIVTLYQKKFSIGESSIIRSELKQFVETSMFIVPLDNNNEWYRFHHLVTFFLENQTIKTFDKEEIKALYLEAHRYFISEKLFEEGIYCAIKAEDFSKAFEIISDQCDRLLNRDDFSKLERWLGMIPIEKALEYPHFYILSAILNDAYGNYPEMSQNLERLEKILGTFPSTLEISRRLWGEYHALKSGVNYYLGKIDEIIIHADKAFKLLSGRKSFFLTFSLIFKLLALHIFKRSEEAVKFYQYFQSNIPADYKLGLMRSNAYFDIILIYRADISRIKKNSKITFDLSKEEKSWITHAMSSCFLASVNYIQNDLEKVQEYTQALVEHRFAGRPFYIAHGLLFEIFRLLQAGEEEKMNEKIDWIVSFLNSFKSPIFNDLAFSILVEIALRRGQLNHARQLSKNTQFNSLPLIFCFYFTQLTQVKLLLSNGDNLSLSEATRLLSEYEKQGKESQNINLLIQIYSLFALLNHKLSNDLLSQEYLKKSLSLAKNGRYIRTFVDLGGEMFFLLNQLSEEERSDEFLKEIIDVFENELPKIKTKVINYEIPSNQVIQNLGLNQKEIEILELVRQGFQNKEIADKLCLSTDTIKKYLYYVYAKLGVNNRTAAISIASRLHLIE